MEGWRGLWRKRGKMKLEFQFSFSFHSYLLNEWGNGGIGFINFIVITTTTTKGVFDINVVPLSGGGSGSGCDTL